MWLAFLLGLAFHNGTNLILGISFYHLQAIYVSFIDWQGLVDWLLGRNHLSTAPPFAAQEVVAAATALPAPRGVYWVGGTLIVLATLMGATGIELAWPVACYPTFSDIETPEITSLRFVIEGKDGSQTTLNDSAIREQFRPERRSALIGRILDDKDLAERDKRLAALWSLLVREHFVAQAPATVAIYKATQFFESPKRPEEELVVRFTP